MHILAQNQVFNTALVHLSVCLLACLSVFGLSVRVSLFFCHMYSCHWRRPLMQDEIVFLASLGCYLFVTQGCPVSGQAWVVATCGAVAVECIGTPL